MNSSAFAARAAASICSRVACGLPYAMFSRMVAPNSSDCCSTMPMWRSEEHTSELQSQSNLVCRLLLEKKKKRNMLIIFINKPDTKFSHYIYIPVTRNNQTTNQVVMLAHDDRYMMHIVLVLAFGMVMC